MIKWIVRKNNPIISRKDFLIISRRMYEELKSEDKLIETLKTFDLYLDEDGKQYKVNDKGELELLWQFRKLSEKKIN